MLYSLGHIQKDTKGCFFHRHSVTKKHFRYPLHWLLDDLCFSDYNILVSTLNPHASKAHWGNTQTASLLPYYSSQGKLFEVDGMLSINEVSILINEALNNKSKGLI